MTARDRIARRAMPRLIVALSTITLPARIAAALRRVRGGSAAVQVFVAFDDPYSAVALNGLAERLKGRRAELLVAPVVQRGIPGDPAAAAKREYAVIDAARLARRDGLELSRRTALSARDTAFLANWAAAIPQGPARASFCVDAMWLLWFQTDGPVDERPYAVLWREHFSTEPPAGAGGATQCEKAMKRRRLYDTPVAVVAGQWFFAHERLEQIAHRLDELGWEAAA